MKTGKLLTFALVLLLALVGCQENDDPGEVVTFPQNATSTDGLLRIGQPDGWVATTGENQITLANSADALNISSPTNIAAGQIFGTANVLPLNTINGLSLDDDPNAEDILVALLDRNQLLSFDLDYTRFDMGGNDAVIAPGTVDNDGTEYGTIFGLVRLPEALILFNFNMVLDGEDAYVDVVEDILRSTQYGAPQPAGDGG